MRYIDHEEFGNINIPTRWATEEKWKFGLKQNVKLVATAIAVVGALLILGNLFLGLD